MPHEEEDTTTTTTTTTSSSSEARSPILAVDMDETIIQSDTEELIPGARDALLKLRALGWKIIIWTCRGNTGGHTREILDRHDIPYDAINENLPGIKDKSRKIVFDAVVDNKNVDFNSGWEAIVEELATRREGWVSQGITKVSVWEINPSTGEECVLQEWGLDTQGRAFLSKGSPEVLELGLDITPDQGAEFLKELQKTVSNTYMYATVTHGRDVNSSKNAKSKGTQTHLHSDFFEKLDEVLGR